MCVCELIVIQTNSYLHFKPRPKPPLQFLIVFDTEQELEKYLWERTQNPVLRFGCLFT